MKKQCKQSHTASIKKSYSHIKVPCALFRIRELTLVSFALTDRAEGVCQPSHPDSSDHFALMAMASLRSKLAISE